MLKVTVLVAIKNSQKFTRGCLESLLGQTIIKHLEIIVIDGGAGNNDRKIVAEYQKIFPKIKYIFEKKPGIFHAWNLGIEQSRAKYITNLNCDDRLAKNALDVMSIALDKNPDTAVVYADSYVTKKANETFANNTSGGWRFNWPKYSHQELLRYCFLGPHPMWRRNLHQNLGYFDESYKIAGDYEFWLRIAEKHKIMRINKTLGLYYLNMSGNCYSNPQLACKEVIRIKQKYMFGGQ